MDNSALQLTRDWIFGLEEGSCGATVRAVFLHKK